MIVFVINFDFIKLNRLFVVVKRRKKYIVNFYKFVYYMYFWFNFVYVNKKFIIKIIILYNVWLYDILRWGLFLELLSVSIFGFFVFRYEGNCLFLFLIIIWSGNFNLDSDWLFLYIILFFILIIFMEYWVMLYCWVMFFFVLRMEK